jgi:peptidoglycan/LPS O-acetylase OafA/YrhL
MAKQFQGLTSLRGIAALMVVLHHYTKYLLPQLGAGAAQYTPFLTKNYLWVDFFFILSGFILIHVYGSTFENRTLGTDYKKYLASRFARIYPLHLFMLALFVVLELFQLAAFNLTDYKELVDYKHLFPPFAGKETLWPLFTNLTLVQAFHKWTYWNEPAWSISAEWIVYLFIPLLIPLAKKLSTAATLVGITFAYLILLVMIQRYDNLDLVTWRSIVRCLCECSVGIALYQIYLGNYGQRLLTSPWFANSILILTLISLLLPIHHLITVMLFSLLILSTAYKDKLVLLNHRVLIFLGTISYSIYMTHWFIMKLTLEMSRWLSHSEFHVNFTLWRALPVLIGAVFIVIVFSKMTYSLIENPFRQRLKRHLLSQHY